MSPSVLTETIWALGTHSETPVLPDRVIVLTTLAGREMLKQQLFSASDKQPCGWERLCAALDARGCHVAHRLKFGLASDHVRLFPDASGSHDLVDLATSQDNQTAADFILRELRAFSENPHTEILASIAGGRKTMSALLMSCMSLLGRAQDRVLHVLVNPPFDTPLAPPFLFPERGVRHATRDGKALRSNDARIELIDVPFVRMRGWYEGAFRSAPPGYAALVSGVQRKAPPAAVRPSLTLDRRGGQLLVAGNSATHFSASEFAVLCLQLAGTWCHAEMTQLLLKLKQTRLSSHSPPWVHDFQASSRFFDEEGNPLELAEAIETLRRLLSSARKKITAIRELAPVVHELLPKREAATTYRKVRLAGPDPFADIRGYP